MADPGGKRILIVTQYFWPEEFRINDAALGLQERGHAVTILTGIPNYPHGNSYPGYSAFRPMREMWRGMEILRSPLVPRRGGGRAILTLNYASFALSATARALLIQDRFDVVFVFEPSPISVAIPAIALRKKHAGTKLILWVQDLWPESVDVVLPAAPATLRYALDRLVRWIYSRCDLVLVQSNQFIYSVRTRAPASVPVRYFPNSAEDVYQPAASIAGSAESKLLPSGFRVMFAGNIGSAQDFPTILAAAEKLKDHTDIHWILIGEGRLASWVRAEVARRSLGKTVHLLGRFPVQRMPAFFAEADVLLATLRRDPILAATLPSKIQSYLASGKPIVASLEGEGARVLNEAEAGIACPTEDPDALAAAVLSLRRAPLGELERLGRNGRNYFSAHFSRSRLMDQLDGWIRDLGSGSVR